MLSKKIRNKLFFWRELKFYDEQLLNDWCVKYNIDKTDSNLKMIAIHAVRCSAFGLPAPFPWRSFEKLGTEENHLQNLLLIAKRLDGYVIPYSFADNEARRIFIPEATQKNNELKSMEIKLSTRATRELKSFAVEYKTLKESEINPNLRYYVKSLHETVLDKEYLIANCEKRIKYLSSVQLNKSVASRILLIKSIINDLQINNISYEQAPLSDNYRIYTSVQGLKTEDREFIFKKEHGYYEIDLSACHLNLIQMFCGLNIDDARNKIINESGLSKSQVKRSLNCTLYGSGDKQIQAQLIEDADLRDNLKSQIKSAKKYADRFQRINGIKFPEESKADLKRLKASETYTAIKKAIAALLDRIEADWGMVDAFGVHLDLTKPKTVLAAVCSSYEKLLLMPLADLARKEGFTIIFDHHDGMTIRIKNKDRAEEILAKIKNKVNTHARKIGCKTTLEIK